MNLIKENKEKVDVGYTCSKNADRIINEFLTIEKPSRKLVYELIDKIEIGKNKTIYIYFTFSELNLINERLQNVLAS